MTEVDNMFRDGIKWKKTADPLFPFESTWIGRILKVRINDFPNEPMYTLIVDDSPERDFDDWPPNWERVW